jgi:hypothetical protein
VEHEAHAAVAPELAHRRDRHGSPGADGRCQGSPVPEGFVIISAGRSTTCPGSSPEALNTYTITKLAVIEIVCLGSPIPAGYVVERTGRSSRISEVETRYREHPGNQEAVNVAARRAGGEQ